MKTAVVLIVHLIVTLAKLARPGGVRAVVAETLLLKHQMMVSNRPRRRAPNLSTLDRFLLGLASLFIARSRLAKVAVVVSPATLLKFHEALKKAKYRRLFSTKSKRKPGPKGPSQKLIDAIVAMKQRNPRFGCPKIAEQISKIFGVDINKDVVRRVLAKHYRPIGGSREDGPSWLTVIGHAKDSLYSIDLFRCESILLRSHWVMVVMDQFTRRIIGFSVHMGDADGAAVCRMLGEALAGAGVVPKYLSSDNDPLFLYYQWSANLRVLGVEQIKTVPYVPLSHPFVERLIGSIRREYLDRLFFWNEIDLRRKLDEFKIYFNEHRTHAALGGELPAEKAGRKAPDPIELDDYRWQTHCRGLFELPVAAKA